ncbi:MAG TPA: hypothetical protein VM841_15880 [Actinomycetota bacterium]|nr:hypothetical protein [Actinomycetota bacterium]
MPSLDFAFLADAAEAEPGRKFYVLGGGIDQIGGQSFPLVHPHMALVMRWVINPTEMNLRHHLEVRLVDADGQQLAKIEGDIEASGGAPMGREAGVNMVINLTNTRFEKPGDFAFEVLMNNQHFKSLGLRVATVPVA